jgi:hypothetical protein
LKNPPIYFIINYEVRKMQFIREFHKVDSNDVCVHLPDEFLDKDVVITIKTVDHPANAKFKTNFKKTKPQFNTLRLNTRGFKFNREEANERQGFPGHQCPALCIFRRRN